MEKVNWLIERYVSDADEQFLEELKRQNYFYKEVRYLDFRPEEANKYFSDHECVLFRGTLNLGRDVLRTSWIPGAYMDEKNLRCTTYYAYFGQYLLNNKYFILPLGELIRRREEILEYFQSNGELFIRPDSNMKSFRAGVFNIQVLNTIKTLGSELRRDETTLVLVSGKRSITKEWRFFVYKDEIITGSLYLIGEERIDERIKGGYLVNYLAEVLKQVNWYPELLYTVDICESEGELFILELGSFSCAGEYGCDLSLIIEAGVKAAWEDYEAVNG
ncbi:ATP-grasp domain-containing protein [Leptolyngbya sp. FACHB-711]|uniref:ATP-grasp domain-containing protein n=1 Tax=unclassified Leptolyngbya TaxID=2650499 RepID=UPI0016870B88|nr:ATP-grasp domain-containing protein [Leptolyngbya sp. FACHB-711]MBD1851311.1 ATP-grasp domain-containing protein [Cyanobacteria bacterium FACHB-502]MBD2026598.1 ATP-grasp domain-containing protein [Leptolyngbya sp. FACHB-711]